MILPAYEKQTLQNAVAQVLRESSEDLVETYRVNGWSRTRLAWTCLHYAIDTGRLQGGEDYLKYLYEEGYNDNHICRAIAHVTPDPQEGE
jgi:hypothetical protein